NAPLGFAFALPYNFATGASKSFLDKLSYRVTFTGREHIIIWLGLLEHKPHTLDIIPCMAPVALSVEITEIKCCLRTMLDCGYRARDLAGDKGLTTRWAFMIEQIAV